MKLVLDTMSSYKEQLKKFLPEDFFPAYGFFGVCILLIIFELISGIKISDFTTLEMEQTISNVFNWNIGEKILVFWGCILIFKLLSDLVFNIMNRYIDMGEKKSLGNGNIYGIGIQIRKVVLIYFSILFLIFPNNIFVINSKINLLLNETALLLKIRNIIFLLVIIFWSMAEVVGIIKNLFIINNDSFEDKYMKEYKIDKLKKEVVQRIIDISGYVDDQENFELRERMICLIGKELDIVDRGIDIESMISETELEKEAYYSLYESRTYDKELADKLNDKDVNKEDIFLDKLYREMNK